MHAIIDRMEGGCFVVELPDGTTVNVPTAGAPADAREGAVVELQDGVITAVDPAASAERADRLRARLNRLKRK